MFRRTRVLQDLKSITSPCNPKIDVREKAGAESAVKQHHDKSKSLKERGAEKAEVKSVSTYQVDAILSRQYWQISGHRSGSCIDRTSTTRMTTRRSI